MKKPYNSIGIKHALFNISSSNCSLVTKNVSLASVKIGALFVKIIESKKSVLLNPFDEGKKHRISINEKFYFRDIADFRIPDENVLNVVK